MVRENNQAADKTWVWTYDNAGNILSRSEYEYTKESLEGVTPDDTINYTYDDEDWGDLLTAYDGQTITYDQIGNPLSDGTWTYTWEHGRELSAMTDGTTTWTYTYNADGLRTSRTNGTATYKYVYNGSSLVQMTVGSDTLYFTDDTVTYNGTVYYYVKNIQGDVIAILDSNGTAVVEYTYDAWGNVLSTSGTMAGSIGTINPLRYRGYVYDSETGLYYLQSRYYDPEIGRFLNADAFASTGQGILGNNMFAYCGNNPVNFKDTDGNEPVTATITITVVGVVTAVIVVVGVGIISYYAVMALWEIGDWVADLIQAAWTEISYATEAAETEPPDVTYPGDDPAKAPDGSEWRGNGSQGSNQGNYYDSNTDRSWHPDLDHDPPIGPHWDLKDNGIWWRVFPDGSIAMK